MELITTMFEVIAKAITSFIGALTTALTGVTSLFYVEPVGDQPGHMTFLGVLLLVAAGVGLVFFAIRWISRLIQRA